MPQPVLAYTWYRSTSPCPKGEYGRSGRNRLRMAATGEAGMAELMSLDEAVRELVHDGDTRRARGLHPPHPVRRGARDRAPAPARPDPHPDDARPGLRPADRHGLRAQARVLLGRQPGGGVAAPLPRRRRERLARPARARGAQPRGDGQPLRGGRVEPAVRRAARIRGHRADAALEQRDPHQVPVHRRDAGGGARASAPTSGSSTPSARTARGTCSSGGSSGCRRRSCSPPRARS